MISLHSQTEIKVIAKLLNVSCKGNQKPVKGSSLIILICQFEQASARLAQSVEHETLNLRVVGSSPTLGAQNFFSIILSLFLFFLAHFS